MSRAFLSLGAVAALALLATTSAAQQPAGLASNAVTVCEHRDYIGHCETHVLGPGMRHVLVPNPSAVKKTISSIAVGTDVRVWVFASEYYTGPSNVISVSRPALGPGSVPFVPTPWHKAASGVVLSPGVQPWNDRIASFIVYPAGAEPEGVFLSPTFGLAMGKTQPTARFFPMPASSSELRRSYATLFDLHARATRARIHPSVEVVLYDQGAMKGNELKIPGSVVASKPDHWYELADYQFAARAESLVVRTRGWTMAMEAPERGGEGDPHRHRAPPAGQPGIVELEAITPLGPAAGNLSLEPGMDRPGHDYTSLDLAEDRPELCRDACAADPACRAYTYVKAGIQGPSARCWLKSAASAPVEAPCCTSGARSGVR